MVDVLSDRWVDLIDSIGSVVQHVVREGDSLTTISYRYYRTTSLYYLILAFNGLVYWSDASPGDIILIPSRDTIEHTLAVIANSKSALELPSNVLS